jgi:hypothetical protein
MAKINKFMHLKAQVEQAASGLQVDSIDGFKPSFDQQFGSGVPCMCRGMALACRTRMWVP